MAEDKKEASFPIEIIKTSHKRDLIIMILLIAVIAIQSIVIGLETYFFKTLIENMTIEQTTTYSTDTEGNGNAIINDDAAEDTNEI